MMFDGNIKPVENVVVGDLLMGPDSTPRRVVSTCAGSEMLYRVTPTKGMPYVVNESHILSLRVTGMNCAVMCGARRFISGDIANVNVGEYLKATKTFRHVAKGWRAAVDFQLSDAPRPIPPYILGLWLGDGNSRLPEICTVDPEVADAWTRYAHSIGHRVSVHNQNNVPMYTVIGPSSGSLGRGHHRNDVSNSLRKLDLILNKHIPHQYKTASREDRLELLAGIIDTDGFLSHGGYDIVVKQERFAQDIAFLCRSLGLAAYVKECTKRCTNTGARGTYWRLSISGELSMVPCRVHRRICAPRKAKKDVLNVGITVEPVGHGEYFGFELSGQDRLFLLGDFTVTHNTILIGAVNGQRGGRNLILQHREELVTQNAMKFRRVNPNTRIGLFTADMKSWDGDATFAMVQTLVRNLEHMPSFDRVTIDEAHHATSPTYLKILGAVKDRNPNCEIFGVTATPGRSDGVGLRKVFSNVADSITLGELISLGFLVRPRTFICALAGTKEKLAQVKRTRSGEYDMDEVASIMDVSVHNETVVAKWKEIAGDRRTIVFASTVEHAAHVCETFRAAGVNAAVVTGNTPSGERAAMMKSLATGDLQVLCNVAVLTEGTDIPPVSCILLLRPCSAKGTLVQMVGRGLRTVNPDEFPGVNKKDCIVIDCGNSLATHKTLEVRTKLDDRLKMCPECQGRVPCTEEVCSLCGHEFKGDGKEVVIKNAGADEETEEVITNIELIEANLLDQSPFKWIDLFGSSKVMIACGFDAWCVVASADGENWNALGKLKEDKAMRRLQLGDRHVCLSAADDFLREHEDDTGAAQKQRRWMRDAATQKQVELLQRVGYNQATAMTFNKYSAAAALNFFWNRRSIEAFVR